MTGLALWLTIYAAAALGFAVGYGLCVFLMIARDADGDGG